MRPDQRHAEGSPGKGTLSVMRGGLLLGIVIIVGGCGGAESASGSLPGSAPASTAEPTTDPVATTSEATTVPPITTFPGTSTTATVPPTTAFDADGLDGEWRVTSGIVAGEPVQLIDGSPITLTAAGSALSGVAACNSYGFTIEPRGAGISFVDGYVNEIGCAAPLAALEAIYLQSFAAPTATYTVEGTTLTWQTPAATWVFERVELPAATPLVGTVWVLNGMLYEYGGKTAAGIEEGRIVFAADGRFTGSTSCRGFTGSWVTDGTTITASDVSIIGECTGPLVDVDQIVVQVLDEGLAATVDGDRLSARPRSDLGLDFVTE